MKKRILSFVLAVVLMTGLLPYTTWQALAAPTPPVASGNVADRIEQLRKTFAGKYFTENGDSCTHAATESCQNCKLSSVLKSMGYPGNMLGDANTCVAFARFAFWYIFETGSFVGFRGGVQSGYSKTTIDKARLGDIVVFTSGDGTGHQGIFLGTDENNNVYVLDFNGQTNGIDPVKYNNNYGKMPVQGYVITSDNYDTINSAAPSAETRAADATVPGTNNPITVLNTSMYISNDNVPVRARPYADDTILQRLNKGTVVQVTGSGKIRKIIFGIGWKLMVMCVGFLAITSSQQNSLQPLIALMLMVIPAIVKNVKLIFLLVSHL